MGSFAPGLATYGGGEGWGPGGGTSAATPLTAAIVALALQQEQLAGRPPLGAVDPLLYSLASGPGYGSVFSTSPWTSSPSPARRSANRPPAAPPSPASTSRPGSAPCGADAFAAAIAAR